MMQQPASAPPIPGTELHLAARDGELAGIIKASKRDLNKPDGSGLTPIHWASWRSNSETVKLLLSKGADPDKPDKDGNTSVHLAAAHGNLSNLRCLLESGASIWSFNDARENPSHLAIKYNRGECFRFLDTLSVRMELTNKYLVDKLKTRSLKNYEKRSSKRSEAQAKAQAHLRKSTASSYKNRNPKSGIGSTIAISDMLNEKQSKVSGSIKSSASAFRMISDVLKGT
ncbi:Usher syndrome type-1G protein-like [Oopsacas minuta]|uniref:Usher syndrome type-1G protein-like n=1 Tax=Oopsacas minuta TaxID=111878 RepID=A0AAV7KEI3_9METZ|nr:Usher syndrome type-1G protein-like [Oopsacas minuta]